MKLYLRLRTLKLLQANTILNSVRCLPKDSSYTSLTHVALATKVKIRQKIQIPSQWMKI